MKIFLIVLGLLGSAAAAQADAPAAPSKHIAKILARADGTAQASAYKVSSVRDEYEIISALGLAPKSQALIIEKKPYDQITAIDPATGNERQIWFDISSFYGRF